MDEKKKKKTTKGSARALTKLFHDPDYNRFISDRLRYAQAKRNSKLIKPFKGAYGSNYASYCIWSGIHPEQMFDPDANSSNK